MLGRTTPFCFSSSAGRKTPPHQLHWSFVPFYVNAPNIRQGLQCKLLEKKHPIFLRPIWLSFVDYPGHSFQHNENEWEPLTLYSVLLHLLHLCDGLPQVICELLAVLRVGGVEVNENLDVCAWKSWSETHSIGVIWKAAAGEEYLQTGGSWQCSDVPFSEGHANRYYHISQPHMTEILIFSWENTS